MNGNATLIRAIERELEERYDRAVKNAHLYGTHLEEAKELYERLTKFRQAMGLAPKEKIAPRRRAA